MAPRLQESRNEPLRTGGRRGQAFFVALVTSLDAMPVKRLVGNELETTDGEACTLGALNKQKMGDAAALSAAINSEDYSALGRAFGIPGMLAQEVMYVNDEAGPVKWKGRIRVEETPEARWIRVRAWAEEQIRKAPTTEAEELTKETK